MLVLLVLGCALLAAAATELKGRQLSPTPTLTLSPISTSVANCGAQTFRWSFSGLTNGNLLTLQVLTGQSPAESASATLPSSTEDTGPSQSEIPGGSVRRRAAAQLPLVLSPTLDPLAGVYVWTEVNLQQNFYTLNASISGYADNVVPGGTLFAPSVSFQVVDGPDISCLAAEAPTSAPTTATTTATATSFPSSSAASAPSNSTSGSSLSSGTIAGAVVGAVVGLALILTLTWFFCTRRRKRSKTDDKDGFQRGDFKGHPSSAGSASRGQDAVYRNSCAETAPGSPRGSSARVKTASIRAKQLFGLCSVRGTTAAGDIPMSPTKDVTNHLRNHRDVDDGVRMSDESLAQSHAHSNAYSMAKDSVMTIVGDESPSNSYERKSPLADVDSDPASLAYAAPILPPVRASRDQRRSMRVEPPVYHEDDGPGERPRQRKVTGEGQQPPKPLARSTSNSGGDVLRSAEGTGSQRSIAGGEIHRAASNGGAGPRRKPVPIYDPRVVRSISPRNTTNQQQHYLIPDMPPPQSRD